MRIRRSDSVSQSERLGVSERSGQFESGMDISINVEQMYGLSGVPDSLVSSPEKVSDSILSTARVYNDLPGLVQAQ